MAKLPIGVRYFGTERVCIIRYEGAADESRHEVAAQVQASRGLFARDTDVRQGDVIVLSDRSNRRVSRKCVTAVNATRDLVEVHWTAIPDEAGAATAAPTILGLHPAVVEASTELFDNGHYPQAIFEALKALENRVKQQSGIDKSGRDLMAQAFAGDPPPIDLRLEQGRSGEDEQTGFKLIFMGVMQGIRNPKGHEVVQQGDPQRAIEYLGLVSVLMRRLDDAESAAED